MAVTIKDIAKAAKVSKATVSYVINDKPGVGEETRQRIIALMKEMNFRPNYAARELAGQSTETIGLIIPDITDMFYASIVRGVENGANSIGYTLNLCTTHANKERELNAVNIFASGRVDAVVLMTCYLDEDYLQDLKNRGIPFVALDRPAGNDFIHSISVDNEAAGFIATQYLLDLGHRRIGFIQGPRDTWDSEERLAGYQRALATRQVAYDPGLSRCGGFDRGPGYRAAVELLSLPERPTAIFAANDLMALGALGAANDYRLRVPEVISIIGVDDIEAAALIEPPLTTIKQPTYEMGQIAIKILSALLKGETWPEKHRRLKPELVPRRSCARCLYN